MDPDTLYENIRHYEEPDGQGLIDMVATLANWIDRGGYVPERLAQEWKDDRSLVQDANTATADYIWVTLL